jgi:replicative DNA helicase
VHFRRRGLDFGCRPLAELEDKVARHAADHGSPRLIIVDDLPSLDETGRTLRGGFVALRSMGREQDATVVVATQVHARVEQRTDKRPVVADIVGWDSVVARPGLVLLLYRQDLYFPGEGRDDELDIIVGENRHGPSGIATVRLRSDLGAIEPISGLTRDLPSR